MGVMPFRDSGTKALVVGWSQGVLCPLTPGKKLVFATCVRVVHVCWHKTWPDHYIQHPQNRSKTMFLGASQGVASFPHTADRTF